jgi:phage gp36-like protein
MSQYATTTDLGDYGLPPDALAGMTAAVQNKILTKASGTIDSYLRGRYSLPLAGGPYPDEIIEACVSIAAFKVLKRRGHNPSAFDQTFTDDYQTTLDWLSKLAKGEVNLDSGADATPTVNEARPRVYSAGSPYINHDDIADNERRGW